MKPSTPTRRQRELLSVARGLAAGLSTHRIAKATRIHPMAVLHHRRTLFHLRITPADVASIIAKVPGELVDDCLLALVDSRRAEQKQRSRAQKAVRREVAA
jgi:hypothetical protein